MWGSRFTFPTRTAAATSPSPTGPASATRPSSTEMDGRRRTEAGFTIVEVLVAILILAIGAMTVFGLLSAATKNTARAKATQVALDRAQQELEALRSLTNKELAMLTTPPSSGNPLNPGYRVNPSNSTYA